MALCLRAMLIVLAALCGSCLPGLAHAHHAASEYDNNRIVEFSGTLSEVAWQNPHVLLKVTSMTAGTVTTWEVECHPVAMLMRSGVNRQSLRVGDQVKVAGYASRLSDTRVFGTNVLTPAGVELVLVAGAEPRWKRDSAPKPESIPPASAQAAPPTRGIFKVWSTVYTDPDANANALWNNPKLALTRSAKAVLDAWDTLRDTVAPACTPQGMPTIMAQPLPMQFEDHGATIVLRLEQYDTVRTIHMTEADAALPGRSLLGYSVGSWEGDSLVVNTTGVSWRYIAPNGLPLGRSARMQERFTPSEDGRRLRYTLLIDDPDTFTAAAVLSRSWIWREGERVREYACGKTQDSPS